MLIPDKFIELAKNEIEDETLHIASIYAYSNYYVFFFQKESDLNTSNIILDCYVMIDTNGKIIYRSPFEFEDFLEKAEKIDYDDFLSHYGVLGMKWGVRKDNYTSGYIPKGKQKKQKKNHKEAINNLRFEKVKESDIPRKKDSESKSDYEKIKDDCIATNPYYGKKGYDKNCLRCSVSYDLRRRGYDVTASGLTKFGNKQSSSNNLFSFYKSSKGSFTAEQFNSKDAKSNVDNFFKFVNSVNNFQGQARFYIGVLNLKQGMGHALILEKTKSDGIYLLDAQSGKPWPGDFLKQEIGNGHITEFEYVRLDNLEPNFDNIGSAIYFDKKLKHKEVEMENQNDYLIHYGVLGMHWGVRKKEYRVQGAKKKSRLKDSLSSSFTKKKISNNLNKRDVSKLSNDELIKKINRLQLEKQYRDLTKSEISRGKKVIADIIESSSKTISAHLSDKVGQLLAEELAKAARKKAA